MPAAQYIGAGTLRLPRGFHHAIVGHARAEAPRECCGLLTGRTGTRDLAAPGVGITQVTNVAPGLDFYEMDPDELFRVTRELDESDRDIVAIYHSHPTGPARPSATDVELAFWPDAWYLIAALADGDAPHVRAFRIADGVISEATVELTGAGA